MDLNPWVKDEGSTLSQHEFCAPYGHDLAQTVAHLLEGAMERFVMAMRASGESLVERLTDFPSKLQVIDR